MTTTLKRTRWALGSASVVGLARLLVACASEPVDPRLVVDPLPDRTTFEPVANVLDRRCGTLDCHGKVGRNLRIYGHEGLRLSPTDRPTAAMTTTSAEYDADYLTVVTLEPTLTSAVVADHGAAPERLTLVRKARGAEHHKGGTVFVTGDPSDRCLTSWLGGDVDNAACAEGATYTP